MLEGNHCDTQLYAMKAAGLYSDHDAGTPMITITDTEPGPNAVLEQQPPKCDFEKYRKKYRTSVWYLPKLSPFLQHHSCSVLLYAHFAFVA